MADISENAILPVVPVMEGTGETPRSSRNEAISGTTPGGTSTVAAKTRLSKKKPSQRKKSQQTRHHQSKSTQRNYESDSSGSKRSRHSTKEARTRTTKKKAKQFQTTINEKDEELDQRREEIEHLKLQIAALEQSIVSNGLTDNVLHYQSLQSDGNTSTIASPTAKIRKMADAGFKALQDEVDEIESIEKSDDDNHKLNESTWTEIDPENSFSDEVDMGKEAPINDDDEPNPFESSDESDNEERPEQEQPRSQHKTTHPPTTNSPAPFGFIDFQQSKTWDSLNSNERWVIH
jgi:hypothetical protein